MWSGKCPVGEMSVRGNVLVGKYPVGEVSGWRIVRSGKCPSGKFPSGKCQSGNCPRGSVSRGTVQSGNCPHTTFSYKLHFSPLLYIINVLRVWFKVSIFNWILLKMCNLLHFCLLLFYCLQLRMTRSFLCFITCKRRLKSQWFSTLQHCAVSCVALCLRLYSIITACFYFTIGFI